MKKIYHLSTCSTCKRIIKDLEIHNHNFDFQDIKLNPLTPDQLDSLKSKTGSYESLFSRKSMKYRPLGLHEMSLTENDYRRYMLEEYSFLKRPVVIIGEQIFVGNSKKTVEEAKQAIEKMRSK